jgi:tetratricopeptide (TPR) repeat protein
MSEALAPTGKTARDTSAGWLVVRAWEGSPAEAHGIATGWRLMSIDGAAPSEVGLFLAMRDGHKRLDFADAEGRLWAWTGAMYPFGIKLSQPVDAAFRRALFDVNRNREALIDQFEDGALGNFGALEADFRKVLRAPAGWLGRLGIGVPKDQSVPPSDDFEMLSFLSLAYVANGAFAAALEAAEAAKDARDRVGQASYSANIIAIDHYVRARIAEAQESLGEAVSHIRDAAEMKPGNTLIRECYARLTSDPLPSDSPLDLGADFPLRYSLPNHDPVGELPAHGHDLSLSAALSSMEPHQILVVLVLGGYRSNYYANLDIERLALVHRVRPGVVADVHIIVSSDYALDVRHRHDSEGLAQSTNLPLTILYDADDQVMSQIKTRTSPARFMLDREGKVRSTGELADESGFWEAIAALG